MLFRLRDLLVPEKMLIIDLSYLFIYPLASGPSRR